MSRFETFKKRVWPSNSGEALFYKVGFGIGCAWLIGTIGGERLLTFSLRLFIIVSFAYPLFKKIRTTYQIAVWYAFLLSTIIVLTKFVLLFSLSFIVLIVCHFLQFVPYVGELLSFIFYWIGLWMIYKAWFKVSLRHFLLNRVLKLEFVGDGTDNDKQDLP